MTDWIGLAAVLSDWTWKLPRHTESFDVFAAEYKKVLVGLSSGRICDLTFYIDAADVNSFRIALYNAMEEPVINITSPYGVTYTVALGEPDLEYLSCGHAIVRCSATDISD